MDESDFEYRQKPLTICCSLQRLALFKPPRNIGHIGKHGFNAFSVALIMSATCNLLKIREYFDLIVPYCHA